MSWKVDLKDEEFSLSRAFDFFDACREIAQFDKEWDLFYLTFLNEIFANNYEDVHLIHPLMKHARSVQREIMRKVVHITNPWIILSILKERTAIDIGTHSLWRKLGDEEIPCDYKSFFYLIFNGLPLDTPQWVFGILLGLVRDGQIFFKDRINECEVEDLSSIIRQFSYTIQEIYRLSHSKDRWEFLMHSVSQIYIARENKSGYIDAAGLLWTSVQHEVARIIKLGQRDTKTFYKVLDHIGSLLVLKSEITSEKPTRQSLNEKKSVPITIIRSMEIVSELPKIRFPQSTPRDEFSWQPSQKANEIFSTAKKIDATSKTSSPLIAGEIQEGINTFSCFTLMSSPVTSSASLSSSKESSPLIPLSLKSDKETSTDQPGHGFEEKASLPELDILRDDRDEAEKNDIVRISKQLPAEMVLPANGSKSSPALSINPLDSGVASEAPPNASQPGPFSQKGVKTATIDTKKEESSIEEKLKIPAKVIPDTENTVTEAVNSKDNRQGSDKINVWEGIKQFGGISKTKDIVEPLEKETKNLREEEKEMGTMMGKNLKTPPKKKVSESVKILRKEQKEETKVPQNQESGRKDSSTGFDTKNQEKASSDEREMNTPIEEKKRKDPVKTKSLGKEAKQVDKFDEKASSDADLKKTKTLAIVEQKQHLKQTRSEKPSTTGKIMETAHEGTGTIIETTYEDTEKDWGEMDEEYSPPRSRWVPSLETIEEDKPLGPHNPVPQTHQEAQLGRAGGLSCLYALNSPSATDSNRLAHLQKRVANRQMAETNVILGSRSYPPTGNRQPKHPGIQKGNTDILVNIKDAQGIGKQPVKMRTGPSLTATRATRGGLVQIRATRNVPKPSILGPNEVKEQKGSATPKTTYVRPAAAVSGVPRVVPPIAPALSAKILNHSVAKPVKRGGLPPQSSNKPQPIKPTSMVAGENAESNSRVAQDSRSPKPATAAAGNGTKISRSSKRERPTPQWPNTQQNMDSTKSGMKVASPATRPSGSPTMMTSRDARPQASRSPKPGVAITRRSPKHTNPGNRELPISEISQTSEPIRSGSQVNGGGAESNSKHPVASRVHSLKIQVQQNDGNFADSAAKPNVNQENLNRVQVPKLGGVPIGGNRGVSMRPRGAKNPRQLEKSKYTVNQVLGGGAENPAHVNPLPRHNLQDKPSGTPLAPHRANPGSPGAFFPPIPGTPVKVNSVRGNTPTAGTSNAGAWNARNQDGSDPRKLVRAKSQREVVQHNPGVQTPRGKKSNGPPIVPKRNR